MFSQVWWWCRYYVMPSLHGQQHSGLPYFRHVAMQQRDVVHEMKFQQEQYSTLDHSNGNAGGWWKRPTSEFWAYEQKI